MGFWWVACLAAFLSGGDAAARAETPPPPNILLVTLDTTRMDRLGFYGYAPDTSPELDRLADESVVYTRAYSVTSWTLPAHASLFTGRFPSSHGADYDAEGPLALASAIEGPEFLKKYRVRGLAPAERTLAELLHERGYATGAVVAGPWLKRVFGLGRGFDHYDDAQISYQGGRVAAQVTDAALPWIDAQGDHPFFLFLNYFDPHGPYTDPEGLARLFLPEGTLIHPAPRKPSNAYLSGTYDGEIRYMDRHLGRLLAHLRARGLYDRTWIIITADHGELLGEHGSQGHGFSLYEEELRVPLVVKHPAGEATPRREDSRVQLTDVLPWILARLGIPTPPGVKPAAPPGDERPVYAEVNPIGKPAWRAWLRGPYKYLWNTRKKRWLYDVEADPGETTDLAPGEPLRVHLMERALLSFREQLPARAAPGEAAEVDAETQRALESLGYLE